MLTRRNIVGFALATPVSLPVLAKAQSATVPDAAIGSKQSAFDALFGAGRTDGWFTVYDFSDDGKAAYWVAWDANGYAHRIAIDYSAISGGGLPFDPGLLGQSQFLPHDAAINAAGDLTYLQVGATGFYIAQHHSDSVQQRTKRSGNILVVDERAIPGDGPNNPSFTRTSVAMEAYEVNPLVPTGRLPTIESPVWSTVFGEAWGTQRGTMPKNPPLPGRWMFDGATIDVVLDNPIPAAEAAQWVSDFLPLGLGEMSTTYWLPAPGDREGLRVCLWTDSRGLSTVALQVVHDGEESGWVDRFVINRIAPAMV